MNATIVQMIERAKVHGLLPHETASLASGRCTCGEALNFNRTPQNDEADCDAFRCEKCIDATLQNIQDLADLEEVDLIEEDS